MWHLQRGDMCKIRYQKMDMLAQHTFSCRALATINLPADGSLVMIRRTEPHVYVISAGVNLNPFFDRTAAGGSGVTEECSRAGMDVVASTTVSEVCVSEIA